MGRQMKPHFVIVTPSIQRDSLLDCCKSVEMQTYTSWIHWIIIDLQHHEIDFAKLQLTMHQQRHYRYCNTRHNDFGHTCTREIYPYLNAEYVHRLDDDNTFAHPKVLEQMTAVTADWGLFPIIREGERFYSDPPRYGHVDTGSVIVKREFAQWPASTRYEADWDFVEGLMKNHPNYQAFPDVDPIMVMGRISRGLK
jgi:hypothetical protein